MNVVLEILKPKSNSFILWEHLLKSAVAFVGTFAMLFFGPLMLGSRNRSGNSENSLSYIIIEYFIEHPEVKIGISVLALVAMNIYVFVKNQKVNYIVKIASDANVINLTLTNMYFSKMKQIEIPLSDFEFYLESKVSDNTEKKQKLVFKRRSENNTIGEINPKHFFWADHLLQVRNVMHELKTYRVENINATNRKSGISDFLN